MPGFYGNGPWCMGPRMGMCLFPGGLILNMALIGLGTYFIGHLLMKAKRT